ncbi:hypothetical protein, partial [Verticiella alkaliphila]|uniref:hypothetical protein n=1 Tax=Verticiella alkaliphila TaxID=2779529 RepID=UPI001C0B9AA7
AAAPSSAEKRDYEEVFEACQASVFAHLTANFFTLDLFNVLAREPSTNRSPHPFQDTWLACLAASP